MHRFTLLVLASSSFTPLALAQGPAFQTPGMPTQPGATQGYSPDSGQSDRFSNRFNPAVSFVIDAAIDHISNDAAGAEEGLDLALRVLEFGAQAWVDPKAWAYFVGAADEESLNIEEAAVHYVGFGERTTLRAGRFFIDFGKQMQTHVHELRTLERPLALRAYLGDEVKGDGLQFDQWAPAGKAVTARWSLGVFANLLPEEAAFPTSTASPAIDERKDLGDLNFTGRFTLFGDVSERSTLQWGLSARVIPTYSVDDEVNALSETDLENQVYGMDLTWGWVDDTGQRRWTVGAEGLLNSGDIDVQVDDPDATPGNGDESLLVDDASVGGGLAYIDYAWNRNNSAGIQYSRAELADASDSDLTEVELYYTRWLSEFQRVRLVGSWFDDGGADEDSLRLAVQYTAVVGAHGHGINW